MVTIELVHIGDCSTKWGLLGELKQRPLQQYRRILAGIPIPLIPGTRKLPALFTPTPDAAVQ